MTVGQLIAECQALVAGIRDGEDVEVFLIDDYGGMRGIGEVRLDRWPREHEDGPLVPGVQLADACRGERREPRMKIGEVKIGTEYAVLDRNLRRHNSKPRRGLVLSIEKVEEKRYADLTAEWKPVTVRRVKVRLLDEPQRKYGGSVESGAKGTETLVDARDLPAPWAKLAPGIREEAERAEATERARDARARQASAGAWRQLRLLLPRRAGWQTEALRRVRIDRRSQAGRQEPGEGSDARRGSARSQKGESVSTSTNTEARDAVFNVLVRLCGAHEGESERLQWAHFWRDPAHREYRFIGALGFGGKFWRANGSWYVNCYREDETPMRKLRIAETNRALGVLHERYVEADGS